MTGKVFISYRREDSAGYAGRIYDRLANELGLDQLFMDVDSIALGRNFVKVLEEAVAKCDVLLAVIGPDWLNAVDSDGERRLENPHDFVRVEIAAALKRDIPVIPILVDGARLPKGKELPGDLADLVLRAGIEVRHASFRSDLDRLVQGLKRAPAESVVEVKDKEGSPPSSPVGQQAAVQVPQRQNVPVQVYISYAVDDDRPPADNSDGKGFVTFLENALRYEFRDLGPDRPTTWRDTKFTSGSQLPPEIQDVLRRSSIFLVVLSPNWLASRHCQAELASFVRHHRYDRDRVVLICKRNVYINERPPGLQGQDGFMFYERIFESNGPAEDIEFYDRGEVRDQRYWDRIKSLSSHLMRLIDQIRSSQAPA